MMSADGQGRETGGPPDATPFEKEHESALLLRDEKTSVLDVALRYVYESVDGYQRSLKKAIDGYDPKPLGYRKKKEGLRIQLEPRGERGYIELIEVETL